MLITRRSPYTGLRVRRGHIQTAIHTFRRIEDGRTITLVGTQHVAEPDYFAELRKVIDEATAAGAVVHYDLLRDKLDAEAAAQTDAERAAFADLIREATDTTPNTPKRIGLGWVRQVEALPPGPDWVNTDVTAVDMARLLGPARAKTRQKTPVTARIEAGLIAKYEAGPTDANRRMAQTYYYNGLKRTVRHRARDIADPVRAAVVRTWRECNAMAAALAETRDVVMVWGAGHLAGFAAILQRNGFGLASTRWVIAAHQPGTNQPH